ncbi:MAG: hypothetical protein ACN6O1_05690 [Comamonas sp.]|uniref:hypothetical protein n=1 Tax=Comamonas sp. TaxID=34028 RepID=UPI003D0C0899
MAEQVIHCPSTCTVTVVHEVALPLLNLSIDDAALLMPSITLVLCVAWGFRVLLRFINSPDETSTGRKEDD